MFAKQIKERGRHLPRTTNPLIRITGLIISLASLTLATAHAQSFSEQTEDFDSITPWSPFQNFSSNFQSPVLSVFHPIGAATASIKRALIGEFCEHVERAYKDLGWKDCPCSALPWVFDYRSEGGYPLVYWDFVGQRLGHNEHIQTTLILGGVHPDEITPVHLAFSYAKVLKENPGIYQGSRVVIAPLVNPDGFFTRPKARTNANGVDLNRNFATADWWHRAATLWEKKRQKNPRHFPGLAPNTEQGTRFQAALISRFSPDKILSVHAPLGFLDYDGPGDASELRPPGPNDLKAIELAKLVSKNSKNFRIIDYSYFPGSLGNFAGNDRRIPTITVELDTTDPRHALRLGRQFFPGLNAAVRYEVPRNLIFLTHENATDPESERIGREYPKPPINF